MYVCVSCLVIFLSYFMLLWNQYFPNARLFFWLLCVPEVCLRFAVCPDKRRFFCQPISIADCIAAVTYVALCFCWPGRASPDPEPLLKKLALGLVLRGLHVFYYFRRDFAVRFHVHWLRSAFKDVFFIFLLYLVFSLFWAGTVYGLDNRRLVHSQFTNMFYAFWWSVSTITTVGYGDTLPVTYVGWASAVGCSFTGVVLYGLVVACLMQRYEEYVHEGRFRETGLFTACCSSITSRCRRGGGRSTTAEPV